MSVCEGCLNILSRFYERFITVSQGIHHGFTRDSSRFHDGFTRDSTLLTSVSSRFHNGLVMFHKGFITISHRFHHDLTSVSSRSHSGFIAVPRQFNRGFTPCHCYTRQSLFFLDQNISSRVVNSPRHKMVKGAAYHQVRNTQVWLRLLGWA